MAASGAATSAMDVIKRMGGPAVQAEAPVEVTPAGQPPVVPRPLGEPPAAAVTSTTKETPPPSHAAPDDKPAAPEISPVKDALVPQSQISPETDDKDTNIKNIRASLRTAKEESVRLTKEKEEVEGRLKKYETGEIVPEPLKELQNEVQRLSGYERLVSLKTSKQFKQKFIEPVKHLREELNKYAEDYGLPPEVMDEALGTKNKAELNRLLSDAFGPVGGLEVKQLITKIQDIKDGAAAAEADAATALKNMEAEQESFDNQQRAQALESIASRSRTGWEKALTKIRSSGSVIELTPKSDNPEFNKNFVEPIQERAATEFGKMVQELAAAGLTELPEHVAETLAATFALATAHGVATASRNAALEYAEGVKNGAKRINSLLRPNIGGGYGVGDGGAGAQEASPSAQSGAAQLIQNVLNKKR